MGKTVNKKSGLQLCFEIWAEAHNFTCGWDTIKQIYTNAFTHGAWMAFEEGERQGREWIVNLKQDEKQLAIVLRVVQSGNVTVRAVC